MKDAQSPLQTSRKCDSRTLRWFAPNRFCTLVVPALRAAGYDVVTGGEAPAALAVSMDNHCTVAAFEFARRHRCPLLLYLWDLPPWQLGGGKPDLIFQWRGRIRRVSRIIGRIRSDRGTSAGCGTWPNGQPQSGPRRA